MTSSFHHQRGITLFMGLIILLILSVLAAAAINASLLQERQAGSYRTVADAFQSAETSARDQEQVIKDQMASTGDPAVTVSGCAAFDAEAWAEAQPGAEVRTQRVDLCEGSTSLAMGRSFTSQVDRKFRVTATDGAGPVNRGARAVVETVFIP